MSSARTFDPLRNLWLADPTLPALPEQPLVSVIVPSFRQGRFIGATLETILAQDYRHLEVIVIDGGSTDGTVEVLHGYASEPRLRFVSEPDEGVADAINKGLAMARGQVLAIQSSDDGYLPGAVTTAVQALRSDERPGIAYGDIVKVDELGRELARPRTGSYSLEAWLSKRTYIPQPAAFFRADLAASTTGWDASYFNCDTEFWLRLIWMAPVRKIDQALAIRRMHGEQRDLQREKISASFARMIDESASIRALPWRLRRAAFAGKQLHRVRYNPTPSPLSNRLLLWRAVLAYPELLPGLQAKHRLFPFGAECLAAGSRLRAMLRSSRA
jgi:glycosyltransferase involved in cell wall biosynthesis